MNRHGSELTDSAHRSGFVGIVGRPNVGKSTILNYYVGEKVAIVSPRPQTTRHRILGIMTRTDAQLMFLDTPGFHQPEHALGRHMVGVAKRVLQEADVLVDVIDARAGLTRDDERVFSRLRAVRCPVVLAINKVDVVQKPQLLPLIGTCANTKLFTACVPISALTGDQMEVLLEQIIGHLPEAPQWYEPTQRTDQTTQQLVGEWIREQVLLATRQEVPHAVAVLVDSIDPRARVTAIQATILVERPGQKAILIGRQGAMLKRIGCQARKHLERLLGRKVYLGLWVKVEANWRLDDRFLRQLGYVKPL